MKKVIITLIVVVLLVAGAVTGIYFAKKHNQNTNPIDVVAVSNYVGGYYGSYESMDGNIVSNNEQSVYMSQSQVIKEVMVYEGQEVHIGDSLVAFDMTLQELKLEKAKTQLEVYKTDLKVLERDLEKLKNITPVEPTTEPPTEDITEEPVTEEPVTEEPVTEEPGTTEPGTTEPGTTEPGTTEPGTTEPGTTEPGTTEPGTTEPGTTEPGTTNSGTENSNAAPSDTDKVIETPANSASETPATEDDPGENFEVTYTKEELEQAIRSKKESITDKKYEIKMAELDIKRQEMTLDQGVIIAKMDGIVQTVDTSEENIASGKPIIVLSGDGSFTAEVSVSEWKLDTMPVGTEVSLYSYETGSYYNGQVIEISQIPSNGYGYSQTTATFYPVTIAISDGDGLREGMWVQVSMDGQTDTNYDSSTIYLPLPYVKKENGNYYVMKDDNGHLKKQFIKTGKTYYGSVIEVKSGITGDDYVAFPYSKDAVEGKATQISDNYYY